MIKKTNIEKVFVKELRREKAKFRLKIFKIKFSVNKQLCLNKLTQKYYQNGFQQYSGNIFLVLHIYLIHSVLSLRQCQPLYALLVFLLSKFSFICFNFIELKVYLYNTVRKMTFSVNDFFNKYKLLITKEIINRELHFLYSESYAIFFHS